VSEGGHERETGTSLDGTTEGDAGVGDEPRSVEAPALAVRDLRKRFGGVTALDGATLDVADGEVVCLVGPNGAGKSTLFDCVTGVHDVDGGRVLLDGTDVTGASTAEVVQRGLSRTFQAARTFPELTVRENMIANQAHADESVLRTAVTPTGEATMARIEELVAFLDIDHLIDEPAGSLSTGQKKLLSVVATLLREPSVVLLDEPTAGVNPALVDEIVGAVLDLNDRGTTFLIVEHDMDVVRELADHVYVLASGTNLVDAPPATALDDPRVLRAYFGE
jgi:branched-chain amino acid transport system ATP-binding protein